MSSTQSKSIWQKDKAHFMHPYTDYSTFHEEGSQVISEASGNYIVDDKGHKMLDGIAGLWCANIGHGRKDMADAIHAQITKMQYYNPFGHCTNEPASELAAKLADMAPGSLNHVFYTCGGSTANDIAMRVVNFYNNVRGLPNKKKIISRNYGYHGSTYFAAALTGIHGTKDSFDQIATDIISYVSAADMYRRPAGAENLSEEDYTEFLANELENHIQQLGPDNVAAFIAEPIMGAGGVLMAPKGYQRRCWEVCQKHDILFVADEVVTAFGRLGEMVASKEIFDYQPDILIVAKGINSGYIPLGAAIFSDEIYEVISKPQSEGGVLSLGFTYSGHATACAAALKNFEILEEENILENVKTLGPRLQEGARKWMDLPIVGDVRGMGFMLGIDLVSNKETKEPLAVAQKVFEKCIKLGLVIRPIVNLIVISPPLTLNEQEVDAILSIVRSAIVEVMDEM
ncbi:MAG: aminotransferase class III-fold pyridoxal phosphate-dependent enzyme [Gammaproteobacteria bacterium]|nr:aminotransferase class III-fold pyridoxal phosphate-dependent enzyme [Gammaproteobacteria bacterium]